MKWTGRPSGSAAMPCTDQRPTHWPRADADVAHRLGLIFVAFVVAHVAQRRRVSLSLARRFRSVRTMAGPGGRLALADAVLTALTALMLASGLWDWADGHPTRIRWHAISGVVLAGFLVVHTFRRRTRLRRSIVR